MLHVSFASQSFPVLDVYMCKYVSKRMYEMTLKCLGLNKLHWNIISSSAGSDLSRKCLCFPPVSLISALKMTFELNVVNSILHASALFIVHHKKPGLYFFHCMCWWLKTKGERYCNVNYVKKMRFLNNQACFSTPQKQNQDFVKEHNRTPLTRIIKKHGSFSYGNHKLTMGLLLQIIIYQEALK